jgi:hypothetical protein
MWDYLRIIIRSVAPFLNPNREAHQMEGPREMPMSRGECNAGARRKRKYSVYFSIPDETFLHIAVAFSVILSGD